MQRASNPYTLVISLSVFDKLTLKGTRLGALFMCGKTQIIFINCAKMDIKRGLLSLILNLAILKVDYPGTPL